MVNPIFSGKLIRLAAALPENAEPLALWTRDDGYLRNLDDDPVRPPAPGGRSPFRHFGAPFLAS